MICCYYNDPLRRHFEIDKIQDQVTKKYYWSNLCRNVKTYVWGCNVCLASKTICYKLYKDLQSLPVPTHCWKDFSMDLVTNLLLTADWKGNSYNSILLIVNCLTKMLYYELVKVNINIPKLAEVIINVMVRHYSLPDYIVNDWGAIFISKFWSSLCYFFGIKRKLSTKFHPQTNG